MKYVAIIPARGGSKGIPGKNLKPICGRPLLAWTIEHARKSRRLSRTIVTTDSPQIAEVARAWGADVPFLRPAALATDEATTESALIHAVRHLSAEGEEPGAVVLLQPTSPVRSREMTDRAIEQFERENLDSLLSVVANHHFYWKLESGQPGALYDYKRRPRRQDLLLDQQTWRETGSLYVTRTAVLLSDNNRLGGRIGLFESLEHESYEIDSLVDFHVAEALLRNVHTTGARPDPGSLEAIIVDFDGVLTDNRVLVSEQGEEAVNCNRSDGLAISHLKRMGIDILIVSTETNPVVSVRARKLAVPVLQAVADKGAAVEAYLGEKGYDRQNVAFVGNDLNDIAAMTRVGWPIAVADAAEAAKDAAKWILTRRGGDGVMAEIADALGRRGDPVPIGDSDVG